MAGKLNPAAPIRKRNTARGLVIHDDQLLLMERWRPDMHYFSIPGGGIETGETPEQAVGREIEEETSLKVEVLEQVLEMRDGTCSHKIYLCRYISGEPHLPDDAPEAAHGSENRFKPGWVPIGQVKELPFTYWEPLKADLVTGLANGFKAPVKIVSSSANR